MPDVLKNSSPGCDTDTGSDEDGDLVVEDVFGGGTVRAVDAKKGHLLAVLERDFVHTAWVDAVIELGLRGPSSEGVTELPGEVTDLADVNGDVGVKGAGCNGKRMPLLA